MATIVRGKNPNKPYTVRYTDNTGQHERSFKYKKDADDFKAKVEHDTRAGIFVDPKAASRKLAVVAASWLERHPGTPKTKTNYEMALRLHILPIFGHRPLTEVANDREGVEKFLRTTLPESGLSASMIRTCYMVLNAIVNDSIRAGKLGSSRLKGIKLPALSQKAEIVFATREQIEKMALAMPEGYDWTIYLMRGCGLRLGEALGVNPGNFKGANLDTLRLECQLAPDGRSFQPLKHRGADDYRDIPAPSYVVARIPSFNMWPIASHRQYREWFNKARDAAGLPKSFTPHMLRHQFASACLAGGIPITDVSKWLGHRNIQVTYGIYGHLVPESWDRARRVLDQEWGS